MKTPNNALLYGVALAVCDAMRHTGASTVSGNISTQINGPKVEKAMDLLQEVKKMECQNEVVIIFNKQNDPFDPLMTLKTKRSSRKRFTGTTSNTAPLKQFKNPRRPRRG